MTAIVNPPRPVVLDVSLRALVVARHAAGNSQTHAPVVDVGRGPIQRLKTKESLLWHIRRARLSLRFHHSFPVPTASGSASSRSSPASAACCSATTPAWPTARRARWPSELGLLAAQLGVVISSLIFAAAVGALVGGQLSDAIGRRKTILIRVCSSSVLCLLAGRTQFVIFSPGFGVLVTGRIVLGLAVGGASTVVPVFLAELSPYEIRGSITGRNELAIVDRPARGIRGQRDHRHHLGPRGRHLALHVRGLRAARRRAVLRHAADARVAALARREGHATTKRSQC